jgi:hypothetical protein
MKPKLILCLALVLSGGLFGCSTDLPPDERNVNDGFQLETEINVVEKAASNTTLSIEGLTTNDNSWWNALDKLDRHYWLWATNTSIPPRLSKVVLAIYPSLTNGYANPQPEVGGGWFYPITILGKTHDPVMASVLRPYLKDKDLADDPGGLNDGETTMRICDEAASAIDSLLNLQLDFPNADMFLTERDVSTNGSIVATSYSHIMGSAADDKPWSGSDPAWKAWNKQIAKLERRLDAMGFTNTPAWYSNQVVHISPVNVTNAPTIDPVTGLPVTITNDPNIPEVDPATGLPLHEIMR